MTRLAREKFPQGKVGDTVKVRVPDIDRGRCDSRNILGVIMEADLTKDLYRIGTKDGVINLWYARNQFSHVQRVLLTSQTFHQLKSH